MGRRGREGEGEAGALLVLLRLAFVRPWDERLESQMAVIEPEGVGRGRTEERTKARVHGGREGQRRRGEDGDAGTWSVVDLRLQSEAAEKLNGEGRKDKEARKERTARKQCYRKLVSPHGGGAGVGFAFLSFCCERRGSEWTRVESQKVGRTHHLRNSP